jgi:hypothetical protein
MMMMNLMRTKEHLMRYDYVSVFAITSFLCGDCAIVLSNDDPLSTAGSGLFGSPDPRGDELRLALDYETQIALWQTVNNSLVPFEQRLAAERDLIAVRDAQMLKVVFAGLMEPVEVIHVLGPDMAEPFRIEQIPASRAHRLHPSIKPERDVSLPVAAQIAHGRWRVWNGLASTAEPPEDRMRIILELLQEVDPERRLRSLSTHLRHNWSAGVRLELQRIAMDRDVSASIRYDASHTLLDMHHATPRVDFLAAQEKIIDAAWQERHTPYAHLMGDRLGTRDPRVAALRIDWYVRQRERAISLSRGQVDQIDHYFENISGKYRNRRTSEVHREAIRLRDKLMALQDEVRTTGDDTKLREFEAELAEQQRQELELRIERIDAWIAENRERLEHEAEEYAEQRRRERERDRETEPERDRNANQPQRKQ